MRFVWILRIFTKIFEYILNTYTAFLTRVRLNYVTTHHDPSRAKICPPTPPPAKIYPPLPTTSQIYPPLPTISQKMDNHPAKAKIYSYITSFRHCFNSLFFLEMQYSFPWRRFCVIKFWSVRFSNSKFLLHSIHFTIFKIF